MISLEKMNLALSRRRIVPVRRGGKIWNRQEINFMRKHYRKYPTTWVARQLGRTVYSVQYKASDLDIRKARPSVLKRNMYSVIARRRARRRKIRRR